MKWEYKIKFTALICAKSMSKNFIARPYLSLQAGQK